MTEADGMWRSQSLVREAVGLFGEYQRTGDLPALARAVPVFRAALAAAVETGAPDVAAYHNNLGYALHEFATATGDAPGQAEAVGCHRAALAATGPDHDDRAAYLCTLSSGLRALYAFSRNPELLREAVEAARAALVSTGGDQPSPATQYAVLAGALADLHEYQADEAVLAELIGAYRTAAVLAEFNDEPGLPAHWNSLGGWLSERYELTGNTQDLEEAVPFIRKALAASSGEKRLEYLSNLSSVLRLRFERTGDLDALTESVAAARGAAAGTAPGSSTVPAVTSNLVAALNCGYTRTGDPVMLAEAISAARTAVATAAPGDPERGGYLNNLHHVLSLDWERTGALATLTESVRVARDAVAATPPGHHLRGMCLTALSGATSELYDRTGNHALLAESVQASRDAVASVPVGSPDHARYLGNLGSELQAVFLRNGDAGGLEEALGVTREALAATPAGHPARAGLLGSLSAILDDLAERTADAGPLAEAVESARSAVAAVASDHPARASRLDDLGAVLTSQFVRTRNSAALLEAVRVREEALAATPEGYQSRINRLVNLAGSVQLLAARTDDLDASLRAAELLVEALGTLPDDHPARALCQQNLARVYRSLYQRFQQPDPDLLDSAIGYAREALAATPVGHADRASRTNALSSLLLDQWEAGQDASVAAEALRLAREASDAAAPDHPDYARGRDLLGWALWVGHRSAVATGDNALADALAAEAWKATYAAAAQPLSPAKLRIGAFRRAAEMAPSVGHTPQEALACIEAAVDLLPGLLPGELDRGDQEYEIASVRHLAAHAAGTAVAAGRPDRAVELLERTRGVLAARELDRRAGHDHGRPLSIGELTAIAADGPVVYLYCSVLRCDALILAGPDDPLAAGADAAVRVVPLEITSADLNDKSYRLLELLGLQPSENAPDPFDPAARREMLAIMGWLRDKVTGPVLAALRRAGRLAVRPDAGGPLPRIWWCPVGEFAYLPLHAVCLDEAVSSYLPTARALRYARAQPLPAVGAAGAPLVIAVPEAPDADPLPGADLEAEVIAAAFPRALRLDRATRNAVLAALPGHPVAHFACHSAVDVDDPGRSRLFLADHAENPLTVADISRLRLPGGLAFLAACETAVTTDELTNEAVHITGAFQLAGYQHVIGTLWRVADLASVDLTRAFYAELAVPGRPGAIDVSRAAVALHQATRRLRDRFPDVPVLWAGHIHVGP